MDPQVGAPGPPGRALRGRGAGNRQERTSGEPVRGLGTARVPRFLHTFWRLRTGVSLVSLVCFVLAEHSWYILVATVMSAIWNITRDHPAVTQRVCVDDRSWSTPSPDEAPEVENTWTDWSPLLNLHEHLHNNTTTTRLRSGDMLVFNQLRICPKEHARWDKSYTAFSSHSLPAAVSLKARRAVAGGPLSAAEFGLLRCTSHALTVRTNSKRATSKTR